MICSAAHIASDACRLSEGSARAGAGLATFLMIMKWLTFENSPIQAIIRGKYIFRHPGHFNAVYISNELYIDTGYKTLISDCMVQRS